MAEEGLTLESACWRSWPAPRLNLIIHIPTFKSISESTKRSLIILGDIHSGKDINIGRMNNRLDIRFRNQSRKWKITRCGATEWYIWSVIVSMCLQVHIRQLKPTQQKSASNTNRQILRNQWLYHLMHNMQWAAVGQFVGKLKRLPNWAIAQFVALPKNRMDWRKRVQK